MNDFHRKLSILHDFRIQVKILHHILKQGSGSGFYDVNIKFRSNNIKKGSALIFVVVVVNFIVCIYLFETLQHNIAFVFLHVCIEEILDLMKPTLSEINNE